MAYFDPSAWRAFEKDELLADLENMRRKSQGKRRARSRTSILILQSTITPFDVYTYLHARFGAPNGMQTFLARDDSDNLFHWDYYLKAGKQNLRFIGATEEVHVVFDRTLSDPDCLKFIKNMRADFGRIGKDKGRFAASLEKWHIFPNQYLAIANRCAELYGTIVEALPRIEKRILSDKLTAHNLRSERNRRSHSKLMSAITSAPTELSILMPVMFESFIGLIVASLIRSEVKRDQEAFSAFVRCPLNQKLTQLADKCIGFARPIEQTNPAFGRYWTVVNKRNDILHGNVDPVRNALEVVYFHGKRPLFKSGGDRIRQHCLRLIDQYKPQEVIDDYLAMHDFIVEILNHLGPAHRRSLLLLMEDTQPGWNDKRKMLGRLFPDHVATTYFDEQRYDWQLEAE